MKGLYARQQLFFFGWDQWPSEAKDKLFEVGAAGTVSWLLSCMQQREGLHLERTSQLEAELDAAKEALARRRTGAEPIAGL